MSERFGEQALQLCSAASLLLGWRPDEFWNCTPAELAVAVTIAPAADGPDAKTIEDLLRRYPDDAGAAADDQ
jgi:uncharacterized phage protein (TIGR02216 family)